MLKRIEAIALLARCGPLAAKLALHGANVELTKKDWSALKDFNKVWSAGWLDNHDIYTLAGLNPSDIETLTVKSIKELINGIQRS